jgi:hypothetical protein
MATIIEVGRDGNTVYGVAFTVCSNAEVIGNRTAGHDESGNGWREEAGQAESAAVSVIHAAGYDYERCGDFRAYNGGPRRGLVEADWFVADIEIVTDENDDDGEVGEEVVGAWRATWQQGAGATIIPADLVAEVEVVLDAAMAAMSAVMDAAEKRQVADRAEVDAEVE